MCWWLYSHKCCYQSGVGNEEDSGHLSFCTSHSWKRLSHLSLSGWKLISDLQRSWSISFTFFLASCRARQIWSLKGRVGYCQAPVLLLLSTASLFSLALLCYDKYYHLWFMCLCARAQRSEKVSCFLCNGYSKSGIIIILYFFSTWPNAVASIKLQTSECCLTLQHLLPFA